MCCDVGKINQTIKIKIKIQPGQGNLYQFVSYFVAVTLFADQKQPMPLSLFFFLLIFFFLEK